MSLSVWFLASTLWLAPPAASDWTAPSVYLPGGEYKIEITLEGVEGASVPSWWLSPAAFAVDGEPLGERIDGAIPLVDGCKIQMSYDLGPLIGERDGGFVLTCAVSDRPLSVAVPRLAPTGLDFMTMPVEELEGYQVLLQTVRGDMLLDFWPDVAPQHVRNFLDLSYAGFYNGIQFHRVSPSFMIQGGCPNTKDPTKPSSTWGTGSGPRGVNAEFSDKKHVRGVLSMARSTDPNSASSQFFVITKESLFLDGQYSVFGTLLDGWAALDAIANSEGPAGRDGTVRPNDPQRIVRSLVIVKEAEAGE